MTAPRAPRNQSGASTLEALRLLGAWNRLAQGHLALGSGCSCGGGAGSIPVSEFERDIVDFLRSRHPAFGAVLDAVQAGSPIVMLLRELARPSGAFTWTNAAARSLLADLSRTIESFERAHAGA